MRSLFRRSLAASVPETSVQRSSSRARSHRLSVWSFVSRQNIRAASVKSRPSATKKASPPLSLEHFLLRSRVLNLYRSIVRAIYKIPDRSARAEPMAHAKGEFMRNKSVTDTVQIRYLASTGKAEWDGMQRYVQELAVRSRG